MSASTRPHRKLAVLVHCLGALTALPALVTPGPPPQAQADPGTTRPARVRVSVTPADTPTPAYRIEVRNDGGGPVDTTVRQELPPGSSATTITAGGRADRADPPEITWRLRLPAHSSTTLNTALAAGPTDQPLTAPACAFSTGGDRPYDCGTATWRRTASRGDEPEPTPLWRRPTTGLGALGALLFAGTGWWALRRRTGRNGGPTATPTARGTLYPRPAVPPPAYRRRTPPVWLVVGTSAAVLTGVVGAAAWTATSRVAAVDTGQRPTSGAWTGQGATGTVGTPLREAAFEFTVYRVACAGPAQRRRCQAAVGVRNLTPEQQVWHGELQRAYLPDGGWVNADEVATRGVNQGRDVFAEPVGAGQRMVLPLVFTIQDAHAPRQLELRSGVFSAGVRVDVP
ncbi:hypothetical protein O7606_11895 [Micromonospora sp. WMMD882]|uniref:hypothetical protein n=1 Tax=Micromonospora sp. WMMD882 TaxID=3015151 RepID=UPI00248C6DA3|nr:hypothetical protein [Micromonospora sp. WMMD882]WBB81997.1 hypothetical protein O7606_11895 [Micromonospora sp. WMMD882]